MMSRSQRKICRESIPGWEEGPADTKGWWKWGREGMKSGGEEGPAWGHMCFAEFDFISIGASLGILT